MPLPKLSAKRLVLCEGKSDVAFINALMVVRNIQGFQVLCPWSMDTKLEGEDAILQLLNGLTVDRGFPLVEKIILVTDSDTDPQAKFEKFKELLEKATPFGNLQNRYPIPIEPYALADGHGVPSMAIALLPGPDKVGGMETLCWEAGRVGNAELSACIDTFANCAGADKWLAQKLGKFRLRCLITGVGAKNPDLPITYLWDEMPALVPLDSPIFDNFTAYLNQIN